MNASYRTSFKENMRVRLTKPGHRQDTHQATVLRVLENPSSRPANQWYDVRFDDGVYGRFHERYLEPVAESTVDNVESQEPGLRDRIAA